MLAAVQNLQAWMATVLPALEALIRVVGPERFQEEFDRVSQQAGLDLLAVGLGGRNEEGRA